MALVIKYKSQLNTEADRVFITDLTGLYAAGTNDGGYGTPNEDLNTLCLLALIQRNASEGAESLAAVGSEGYYNPSAVNTDQTIFEFVYESDGWHTMDLIALPVSVNRDEDINGNTMVVGDHFYLTSESAIHVKTGAGASDLVTDLTTVLDQTSTALQKTRCEEFFMGKLSVEREAQYTEYRRTRKGVCKPDKEFNAIRELTEDLISADQTFRSGLTTQAQDQIEIVIDEQNV